MNIETFYIIFVLLGFLAEIVNKLIYNSLKNISILNNDEILFFGLVVNKTKFLENKNKNENQTLKDWNILFNEAKSVESSITKILINYKFFSRFNIIKFLFLWPIYLIMTTIIYLLMLRGRASIVKRLS